MSLFRDRGPISRGRNVQDDRNRRQKETGERVRGQQCPHLNHHQNRTETGESRGERKGEARASKADYRIEQQDDARGQE